MPQPATTPVLLDHPLAVHPLAVHPVASHALAASNAPVLSLAWALAALLAADGLIHLYWATGRTWPAADNRMLSRTVLNTEVPFTRPALLALAALLGAAAAAVLTAGGVLGPLLPPALPRWATATVASGMLIRGLVGLVWATGRGTDVQSLFHQLNIVLYTPLCLAGAAAGYYVSLH